MKKLDWVASSTVVFISLVLSGVIFIGNHVPITITCQLPASCAQVGPFGSLVFAFSRPVRAGQVEKLWQTAPQVAGKWNWLDDQHVRWNALQPLPPNQKLAFQFVPGQAGQNGEQIGSGFRWQAMVRSPRVIVMRNAGSGQELFSYGLEDGSSGMQITHSSGRVYDYNVSPDGESVVFSVMNDVKGIDLWMIQRDGSNQHKILDCKADRCSTPAWSPLAQELAYTRENAGLDPNGPKGAPRIWILDVSSGQTAPLFADLQKIGYGPEWSPDGKWLSIWNGTQGGILVVNRNTGESFMLESSNGDVGCWAPDSQSLYYANMVTEDNSYRSVIFKANIGNRSISTILGGDIENKKLSVDSPVCNPKDKWIAVSIQADVKIPDKELFYLNPNAKEGITIMDDASRIPSFYSWSPDGERLVYQIDLLGGKANNVEIWAWDWRTGKAQKITDGGRSPQWLP